MKLMRAIVCLLIILTFANCSIYDQYYAEAQKIAESMTIDQKLGQIIQLNV